VGNAHAVKPTYTAPAGACDAHTHVFGPPDRFPLAVHANYEPPPASLDLHAAMMRRVGVTYGVIVQPAPYGADVGALLDALSRGRGRLRGIAVATGDASDAMLERLRAAGVCGLRFCDVRNPSGGGRYPGTVGSEHLSSLAPRMRVLGMHAQIWASCEECAALVPTAQAAGLEPVLDHMACVDASRGTKDAAFQRILALLREGGIWVKLSICRRSTRAPQYEDLRPFHDALVEANSGRLLWGTDWPFVRMGASAPDPARLLDQFARWTPDPVIQRQILVENPAKLYGFAQ
jgi:2-pyrone-4,6-dicarboxylate lactonase